MPWEIDHALLIADKLKQSIYHIDANDKVYIDTALNLSSYVIDWDKSKLSKEFFVEKYKLIDTILKNKFVHKPFVYDGNELYGHLDLQKTIIQDNIDYYVGICPDIDFSDSLLFYLIEYAKRIKTQYFVLTPQIFRCWDASWDVLVNEKMMGYDCEQCLEIDSHKIRFQMKEFDFDYVETIPLTTFKFAGWFDLYNKNFFEKLAPVLDEWHGYGPWDFYATNVCNLAKSMNVDVKQYLLKNEVIWFYDTGCMIENTDAYAHDVGALKKTYLKFIVKRSEITTQAASIYKNINTYVNRWMETAKKEKII
jgi:hypothetical protein